jgi:nitric oxide reductase large subunit
MTWAWIILGWLAVALIVAPTLGRHFDDPDEDWP